MLSPECRPIAAVLFMSGAARFLCDFYRLGDAIAEVMSENGLNPDLRDKGLFLRTLELTLIQMHHEKFAEWSIERGWFLIRRNEDVLEGFFSQISRIPGFNFKIEQYRAAGNMLYKRVFNDIPPA